MPLNLGKWSSPDRLQKNISAPRKQLVERQNCCTIKKDPLTITVAAVIEDVPYNSNVKFEMVCSIDDYLHLIGKWWGETWNAIPVQTYIKLKKGTDPEQAQLQINRVIGKYMNNQDKDTWGTTTVRMEKISEKHFRKDYTMSHPTERFVGKTSLQILYLVGLITLVISWLNYINFLIFQNMKQFKEIGIREGYRSLDRQADGVADFWIRDTFGHPVNFKFGFVFSRFTYAL